MNGEISLSFLAQTLLNVGTQNPAGICPEKLVPDLINGRAVDSVYKILSLSDRREHGIFFSGPAWASKILSGQDLTKWNRFIDPSVGVGDLLLEVCKSLPLRETIDQTLEDWSERLIAIDLRKSFLEIAWIRIQAFAMHRHKTENSQSSPVIFRGLPNSFIVGDALLIKLELRANDCVVMNPPYQRIVAPSHSFVGNGKRSAAALHLEQVLLQAPPNVGIFALIPDVLRSGSSYKRFRAELSKRADIMSFTPYGAFGIDADIDVSILAAMSKAQEEYLEEYSEAERIGQVVGDFFEISVGPVVPHRTPNSGAPHGYLTAKNAGVGSEIDSPQEFATYNARLEKGPFVIVRRTSSPSDKQRARSTLVTSKEELLVENHLLILRPKDLSVPTCRALIRVLENDNTNEWLNSHIRCRHLTVEALANIPWTAN